MCAFSEHLRANSILEKFSLTISNLVHNFDLQKNYLDKDDPWVGMLADTTFDVQSMYCTTLQAMTIKLILVSNMIIITPSQ